MFLAALFTIAPKWKQPKWSSHTMEYYSALTRKEILTHAAAWKDLEDMVLSETSQSHKTDNLIQSCPSHRNKAGWRLPGLEEGSKTFESWVSVVRDEKVLQMGGTATGTHSTLPQCTLQNGQGGTL